MGIHQGFGKNDEEKLKNDLFKRSIYPESGIRLNDKIYDDYNEQGNAPGAYSVKIARDFEDMAKMMAIRSSAYFSDPEHIYRKHFDGNDFSATHLIGHVGDEPVATVRIRYFADFARVERLAVRPTHRKSRIAFRIVKAAFAFCRDKGYRRLSGVAREEMVPFWSMFGGEVSRSKEPIFIYGLPHYEMFIEFPANPEAVSESADPLLLLRPEGRWHEAGYHEKAAPRAEPVHFVGAHDARRPADVAGRLSRRAAGAPRPAPLAMKAPVRVEEPARG